MKVFVVVEFVAKENARRFHWNQQTQEFSTNLEVTNDNCLVVDVVMIALRRMAIADTTMNPILSPLS
jgi:hypothetical protein